MQIPASTPKTNTWLCCYKRNLTLIQLHLNSQLEKAREIEFPFQ